MHATSGQGDDISPAAITPPKNASKPKANAHQGPLGNVLTSDMCHYAERLHLRHPAPLSPSMEHGVIAGLPCRCLLSVLFLGDISQKVNKLFMIFDELCKSAVELNCRVQRIYFGAS